MKKNSMVILSLLVILCCPASGWPAQEILTITGLVKRPMTLTADDLAKFRSATVRINDIKKNGDFRGVFTTQGVPLKNLLEVALVEKEASSYAKPVDLAIVVRNKAGKKITLSWGEVFYRNPADVVIAYAATPVMPHHTNCARCHAAEFSKPYMDQLSRTIGFPKLVLANDFDADRSLEEIVNIEVVNLKLRGGAKKKEEMQSPRIILSDRMKNPVTVSSLDNLPRTSVAMNIVGDGRGFHGRAVYTGVPLVKLISAVGLKPDLRSVVVVSSPDGYRSLVSWGELVLSPQGERIIIADELNGKPIERGGKFVLVVPDDLAADREVKAVSMIDVHTFNDPAKIYLIGMGPGDTDLITREAISALGRADVVVAPGELFKTFSSYLAGKTLVFDPFNLIHKNIFAKAHSDIPQEKLNTTFEQERENAIREMKKMLADGRNIAFLDWGDPLIYGSSRWIRSHFNDDEIETIPSMSALNAANAVLGRDVTCKGSLVLTVPRALRKNEALLKAAADNGDTVVIYIGLKEFNNLLPLFRKYYQADTPVAFVYNAGISKDEHKLIGTLQDIQEKTAKETEESLGMIYVGPCLAEKSGECH